MIEVLVAIGVLAVLSAGTMYIINPSEKIASSRDTVKKSHISQIGRALKSFSISSNGAFPAPSLISSALVDTGEMLSFPNNPSTKSFNCSSAAGQGAVLTNGYCYNTTDPSANPRGAVIYAPLESASNTKNCSPPAVAWYIWSAIPGTSGIDCTGNETTEPDPDLSVFAATVPPSPTPTMPPPPSPTRTPTPFIPPPTATPTIFIPPPSSTPTPVTCASQGGTCFTSCPIGRNDIGKLNCTGTTTCCK